MLKYKKIGLLVLIIFLFLLPLVVRDKYMLSVIIMAGIWIILASSMNLMMGYAGQLPLGHAAFYGIGAYTSGLLNVRLGIPFWVGMPVAGAVSTALGWFIGKLTFKVRGSYFVLVTMSLGHVMRLIANNWMSLTNGPMGLQGINPPAIFGKVFSGYAIYYYLILLLDILVIYIIWRLVNSRFGRAFIAINENESLARAIGVVGEKYLMMALMISTLFAGIAGAFYAHYVLFVSPDLLFFSYTVTMVVMVTVGGKRTIAGPIVGAILFTLIPEFLRFMENYRMLVYGLILMATILFMKKGIVPAVSGALKRIGRGGGKVDTIKD